MNTTDRQLLQFHEQTKWLRAEAKKAVAQKPFDKVRVAELLGRLRQIGREMNQFMEGKR